MLSVSKDRFYGWVLLTQGGSKVTSDGKVLCFPTKAQAEKGLSLLNEEIAAKLSRGKQDGS